MSRLPAWAFVLGLLFFVLGTAVSATALYRVAHQLALDTGAAGLDLPGVSELVALSGARAAASTVPTATATAIPSTAVAVASNPAADATAAVVSSPVATAVPISTTEREVSGSSWEDPRRITILLMGIDERSAVNAIPSPNTDSMMLITVDPARKTAAVLSLPRDLWVAIPGFSNGRINTAYKLGVAGNYPGGGPGLAKDTVAQNLGIVIDYHLRVNFVAFEETVDAIFPSGVRICVEEEIHDPDYPDAGYGTIDVYFPEGCQRLGGQELLQYARTRATFDGDFGRSGRQQQVLKAMQSEVGSLGGMVNLIVQLPALWPKLADHFETNLTFEEIRSLLTLAGELSAADVNYDIIDQRYVEFGTTANGEQVLIPRQNDLSQLADDLLNPQRRYSLDELRIRAGEESAQVVIMNGAGIEGLAAAVSNYLGQQGLAIYTIGNAPQQDYERSAIHDNGTAPWTARYIAALFGWGEERIAPREGALSEGDVTVLAGADIEALLYEYEARRQSSEAE